MVDIEFLEKLYDDIQDVTLKCPGCWAVYISTDWPGCPSCNFRWDGELSYEEEKKIIEGVGHG